MSAAGTERVVNVWSVFNVMMSTSAGSGRGF
jgi:hypothetical protein